MRLLHIADYLHKTLRDRVTNGGVHISHTVLIIPPEYKTFLFRGLAHKDDVYKYFTIELTDTDELMVVFCERLKRDLVMYLHDVFKCTI